MLAGNISGDSGRVQVFYSNTWGTVCSDGGWSNADAKVVCRTLGFSATSVISTIVASVFGSTNQMAPIWLSSVQCTGTEMSLSSCKQATVGLHTCVLGHAQDAGVYCQG